MTESILIYIFCILILGVLDLGVNLQRKTKGPASVRFSYMIISALLFFIASMLSEILDGKSTYSIILYVLNILAFLFVDLLVGMFALYLRALLIDNDDRKVKLLNIVVAMCAVRAIIIIALSINGKLFAIEDGFYVEGEMTALPYILSGVIMLVLLTVVIINRKCFTARQFVVIVLYLFVPVLPIVVEMYTDLYVLTPMSLTLSILMIYVLIQDSALERINIEKSILSQISYTDQLTELNNRRAYYECLQNIDRSKEVGVAFCDLNGLKKTNDEFGHSAGDLLLQKFATLLSNTFKKEEIFRISGDEFVVIASGINQENFNKRIETLKKAIKNNGEIASVGYEFGDGSNLERLISDSEIEMYENKKIHHNAQKETDSETHASN